MAVPATRKSVTALLRQGWNEIPEVLGSTLLAVAGLAMGTYGCYNYIKRDGDNRRYKATYVIMRPDDPKAKLVRKE